MSREHWSDVIRTNLDGVFNMTHRFWNGMQQRKFGLVINIFSINGQKGQFAKANYSAAKIACCVVFLASDDAGLITGAALTANGADIWLPKSQILI
ncbi:MAG: SDR family NAD(P)-dependent oxidoreductase, partial [Planktomarina sp.]|nr:SDR family NAD(P)-dependent oxidoreductase [Planktomarina sp.]